MKGTNTRPARALRRLPSALLGFRRDDVRRQLAAIHGPRAVAATTFRREYGQARRELARAQDRAALLGDTLAATLADNAELLALHESAGARARLLRAGSAEEARRLTEPRQARLAFVREEIAAARRALAETDAQIRRLAVEVLAALPAMGPSSGWPDATIDRGADATPAQAATVTAQDAPGAAGMVDAGRASRGGHLQLVRGTPQRSRLAMAGAGVAQGLGTRTPPSWYRDRLTHRTGTTVPAIAWDAASPAWTAPDHQALRGPVPQAAPGAPAPDAATSMAEGPEAQDLLPAAEDRRDPAQRPAPAAADVDAVEEIAPAAVQVAAEPASRPTPGAVAEGAQAEEPTAPVAPEAEPVAVDGASVALAGGDGPLPGETPGATALGAVVEEVREEPAASGVPDGPETEGTGDGPAQPASGPAPAWTEAIPASAPFGPDEVASPARTAGAERRRPDDRAPLEAVGPDIVAFLVDKVVGADLHDAQGHVLATRGRRIDADLVRSAEGAGCLPDLILHMEYEKA